MLKYKWYGWSNALTFRSSYVCKRDARYTIITLYRCCNNIIIIVITSRHSYVSLYGNLYRHEMSLVCILLSMAWLYWAQRFSHMRVDQPRVNCIRDHETYAGFREAWNEAAITRTVGSDNDDSESSSKKSTTGKNINELLLMIFCMLQNFWGENLVYYIINMLVDLYWSSTRS